jgi:hypothetical protein
VLGRPAIVTNSSCFFFFSFLFFVTQYHTSISSTSPYPYHYHLLKPVLFSNWDAKISRISESPLDRSSDTLPTVADPSTIVYTPFPSSLAPVLSTPYFVLKHKLPLPPLYLLSTECSPRPPVMDYSQSSSALSLRIALINNCNHTP